MKFSQIIIFSLFVLFLTSDCQTCSSPVYIINAYNGLSLGLTLTTCNIDTRAPVVLNKNFDSWCIADDRITYASHDCNICFYATSTPLFEGISPLVHGINIEDLSWNVTSLHNGFYQIVSQSVADDYYSVGVTEHKDLTLAAPAVGDLKFSWIIIPDTN